MTDNINIANFDFDTDKLIKALTDTKTAINAQSRELSNFRKSISDVNKELNALEKENTSILKQMSVLRSEGKQNTEAYKGLKNQLDQNEQSTKALKEQEEQLVKTVIELEPKLTALKNEYKLTSTVLKAVTADTGEFVSANNKAAEAIDRQNKTINAARANNRELLDIRNELNPELEEEARLITLLNAKLDENNKFIKENVSAYEKQKINIGNYTESIQNAFADLNIFTREGLVNFISKSQEAGGTGKMLEGTFKQITTGIWGATKAALAFIATPLGAALAALAGVALVTKKIWDYNRSIQENIKLVENLTGATGQMADEIRNNAKGIADAYDLEFKDIANAMDALVDTGVVGSELEALEKIKEGLAKAPDKNGFVNSLEDTALKAKQAGLNLDEVLAAKESIERQGIDGEAFFGSMQKASQNLVKDNEKLKDTLTNAFGASFSKEIIDKVRTGELSTIEALNRIDEKGQEVGISAKNQADLQIQLFGKQSLAAGGYAGVMDTVKDAVEKTNAPLTEMQKIDAEIAQGYIDMAKEKDAAFKSDSVIGFQKNLELFYTKASTIFFKVIGWAKDFAIGVENLMGRTESLTSIWNNLQKIGQALWKVFDTIQTTFARLTEKLGLGSEEGNKFVQVLLSFFDPIKKLEIGLNLFADAIIWIIEQFEKAVVTSEAFALTIANTYKAIKNLDFNALLNFGDRLEKNIEFVEKENELYKVKRELLQQATDFTDNLTQSMVKQRERSIQGLDAEKVSQKDLDKAREDAYQRQIQRMNEELDLLIANQGFRKKDLQEELEFQRQVAADSIKILTYQKDQEKITHEKHAAEVKKIENELAMLTAELAVDNAKREIDEWKRLNQDKLDESKFFTKEELKIEDDRLKTLRDKRRSAIELEFQNQLITKQEQDDRLLELDEQYLKEKDALYQSYDEQRKIREAVQAELDFETKIIKLQEDNAKQFEIEQAIRDEQRQNELEQLQIKAVEDNYTHEMYKQAENNINRKYDEIDKNASEDNEKKIFETRVQYAQMALSALGEVIGKETAAGKALAIAQIGLSTAMAIMKSYEQLGPIGGTIFAAIVGTVSALQIKKVISTKPPKVDTSIRGYATGGRIVGGSPISRPNGDDVLITAKRGEVILNEEQQRKAGGYNFFSALGVPGFATGGNIGNYSMPPSQSAFVQNQVTNQINLQSITDAVKSGITESAEVMGNAVYQGSAQGSQSGIRDLSTDRQILKDSAF